MPNEYFTGSRQGIPLITGYFDPLEAKENDKSQTLVKGIATFLFLKYI